MADSSKVPEQFKLLQQQTDVGWHRLMNILAAGLMRETADKTGGMVLSLVGKRSQGGKITATLIGTKKFETAEEYSEASEQVREMIDNLKNPANLQTLLKQ